MKSIYFILILIVITYTANSQNNNYKKAKKYNKGIIYGKITDKNTKVPIEFSTIIIISKKTKKAITGGVTNNKGYFEINNIPVGFYKVKISFIGYNDLIIDSIKLTPKNYTKNLGIIKLTPKIQSLGEISVQGEKKVFQNTLDKKIINVDKDITSEGASVSEVLRNVPSVDVDVDGNISLRGSKNVKVLIDNKPSAILGSDLASVLDQIPASSIESIEIITNPSAKYNPEGMAGIINIKLKKNNLRGTNGNFKLTAGTGNKYNASIGINHRQGKLNIFANYSFRYHERTFSRVSNMTNFIGDSLFYIDNFKDGNRLSKSHMINAGFDYNLNKRNTISFTGMFNKSDRNRYFDSWNNTFGSDKIISAIEKDISESPTNSYDMDYNLSYKKEFLKKGTELTANIIYSSDNDNNESNYTAQDYNIDGNLANNTPYLQNENTIFNIKILDIKTDYVNKLSENSKLETGYESRFRNFDNDYKLKYFDYSLNKYVFDTLQNNHFNYLEQVHSVYGIYSNKYKKLKYQAGIRLEQVFTNFDLLTTSEIYNNSYFSYYPSAHLGYEFNKKNNIQLSYSRRVNRPSIRSLNPFKNISDPYNIHQGNPYLKPEYINSLEFGYNYKIKRNSFMANVYYKQINNTIYRFKTVDSLGVSTITFQNLLTGKNYGLELTSVLNLIKWESVNASFNFFQTKLDASNLGSDLNSENLGWSAKLMSNTILPYKFMLQVSFRYRSPFLIPQGEIKSMYNTDIAIRKKILQNKGTLSVRVSDIFNTRKFSIDLVDDAFTQSFTHQFESRVLYLTFSYRFGKQFKSNNKKRYSPTNNSNNNGMDIGL